LETGALLNLLVFMQFASTDNIFVVSLIQT